MKSRQTLRAKTVIGVVSAFLCINTVAACSTTEPNSESSMSSHEDASSLGTISLYGAASLREVLPDIMESTILTNYPDTKILYNFNGSSSLVDELAGGAPADILLTADEKNMGKAQNKGLVDNPQVFTSNTLVLVVPLQNPANITKFSEDDLNGSRLVVCAPEVPCGNASHKLAELNNISLHPVSEEQSVSDVLDKVASGEADAGIVYKTDAALKADRVKVIDIPHAPEVVNNYMIALSASAPNKDGAQSVLDAVMSDDSQAKLEEYGFSKKN